MRYLFTVSKALPIEFLQNSVYTAENMVVNSAERSRSWVAGRALGIGLTEAAPAVLTFAAILGGQKQLLADVFSSPLLHNVNPLITGSVMTLLAWRGALNANKWLAVGNGPDSAEEYYNYSAKWRRRTHGLEHIIRPFNKKVSTTQ